MNEFLKVFKHLLPRSKTWTIVIDKLLRGFFVGLANFSQSARDFIDLIFLDIDPQKTRQLSQWQQQFALRPGSLTEQQQRDILEATWAAQGGQDPRYIEDTLQAAGFNVYIHEWWVPIPGRPGGGSINGDEVPVVRNPHTYLNDGSGGDAFTMSDGNADSQDFDILSQDGGTTVPLGYPLVNKIIENASGLVSDGTPIMQDGGVGAQDGGVEELFKIKEYLIPVDPTKYPFFLYFGGPTFPDQAFIPNSRRDEFEDLCLKICPTEQWLGILVTYT